MVHLYFAVFIRYQHCFNHEFCGQWGAPTLVQHDLLEAPVSWFTHAVVQFIKRATRVLDLSPYRRRLTNVGALKIPNRYVLFGFRKKPISVLFTSAPRSYVIGNGSNIFASEEDLMFKLPNVVSNTSQSIVTTRQQAHVQQLSNQGQRRQVTNADVLLNDVAGSMRRARRVGVLGQRITASDILDKNAFRKPLMDLLSTIDKSFGTQRDRNRFAATIHDSRFHSTYDKINEKVMALAGTSAQEDVNFELSNLNNEPAKPIVTFNLTHLQTHGHGINFPSISTDGTPTKIERNLSATYGYDISPEMFVPLLSSVCSDHDQLKYDFCANVKFCSGYEFARRIFYSCCLDDGKFKIYLYCFVILCGSLMLRKKRPTVYVHIWIEIFVMH